MGKQLLRASVHILRSAKAQNSQVQFAVLLCSSSTPSLPNTILEGFWEISSISFSPPPPTKKPVTDKYET